MSSLNNTPIERGVISTPSAAEDDDETIMTKAMVIVDLIAFPMTMQAAVELGILEIIANKEKETGGAVTPTEVAAELKTNNPAAADMVGRMLGLLTAFSVVNCSVDEVAGRGKVFGISPVGRLFVKDDDGVSLGPLLCLHQERALMEGWYKQKDAVLEGGVPFDKAHGMSAFQYMGTDPRLNEVFNKAMFVSMLVMKKILQYYNGFETTNRLVDVGGGIGHNLKIIISKYPNVKGINYDLPHVIKHGISHPGIEHVGGDMFEKVPSGDVIFMKWILHDWSDEYCLKLLKNCHEALPLNGKAIVVDYILAEVPEATLAAQVVCQRDLIMMTHHTGKERTKKQFLALAKAAGFSGVKFEATVCGFGVMEFYK